MTPQSEVPEGIVKLTQTLLETPHLRSWFYSLEHLLDPARNAAFTQMAAQMHNAGEDPDLISAVALLAHPKMYEAVLAAVRERADEPARTPNQAMQPTAGRFDA